MAVSRVVSLDRNYYQEYYNLNPVEALVSAAILENSSRLVSDPVTRAEYRRKIIRGERTIAIGDLCVFVSPII